MPMPHRVQMQVIKRRLIGKTGNERVRELRAILADLPDYKNGPYADIRKWVTTWNETPNRSYGPRPQNRSSASSDDLSNGL